MIEGWKLSELMTVNTHLIVKIELLVEEEDDKKGQRKLDSHANMIVCGKYCWNVSYFKRSIDVTAL